MYLKYIIKNICPPFVWHILRFTKYAIQKIYNPRFYDQIKKLKLDFDKINEGTESDSITIRDGIKLRIHPDSRIPFEHFCFRSPECTEEMDSFLDHASNCKNLLDIGALHGIFALVFASTNTERSVIAVDASPMAFSKLLYNVHKNNLTGVKPIECAITDSIGTIEMHYESEHAVSAGTTTSGNTINIEANTGDNICAQMNFAPDAIKIDVEGHEVKVLRGLGQTLLKHRPIVFLEIHPIRIIEEGNMMSDLIDIFSELDYTAKTTNGVSIAIVDLKKYQNDFRIILSPQINSI